MENITLKIIFLLVLSFMFSGCFVSQDVASWKQIEKYDSVDSLSVDFELGQSEKFINLPFICIIRGNKKGIHVPFIRIVSKNGVKSISEFKFTLYDTLGKTLLVDTIQREINLNNILDYRALSYDFGKKYLLKELLYSNVGENIMVDYEFNVLYFDGRSQKLLFTKRKLILIRERNSHSFF